MAADILINSVLFAKVLVIRLVERYYQYRIVSLVMSQSLNHQQLSRDVTIAPELLEFNIQVILLLQL